MAASVTRDEHELAFIEFESLRRDVENALKHIHRRTYNLLIEIENAKTRGEIEMICRVADRVCETSVFADMRKRAANQPKFERSNRDV